MMELSKRIKRQGKRDKTYTNCTGNISWLLSLFDISSATNQIKCPDIPRDTTKEEPDYEPSNKRIQLISTIETETYFLQLEKLKHFMLLCE